MKKLTFKKQGIDEYYVLKFISENKNLIRGRCLLVCNTKFLTNSLRGEIESLKNIKVITIKKLNLSTNNKYDTVIALNILNESEDFEKDLQKIILQIKKGGSLLATFSTFGFKNKNIWGFTEVSIKYFLKTYFNNSQIRLTGYGNVLTGRFFINGDDSSKLTTQQLDKYDPYFPVIIGARITEIDKLINSVKKLKIHSNIVVDEEKQTFRGFIATLLKRPYPFLEKPIQILRLFRALLVRNVKSKNEYISQKSTSPISKIYGFDRGVPIDRYYIEKFLYQNRNYIKGKCLEIVSNQYTVKFGGKNVSKSEVLDIFPSQQATIQGDLRNLKQIKDNEYDCLIITQTLNVIDDYQSSVNECYRILKPGGVLLITVPTISPCWNIKINFWRFSVSSAKYMVKKYFKTKNILSTGYGNSVSSQAFWCGFAQEDLLKRELNYNDKLAPLIVGVVAIK